MRKLLLFTVFLCFFCLCAKADSTPYDILKRSVVTIKVRTTKSARSALGCWSGTGFLCDLKNGLLITNRHVAVPAAVASYTVVLTDGQEFEAECLYVDPIEDYAFLRLKNPDLLPSGLQACCEFAEPILGEKIFMMGNNQGKQLSIQEGRVVDLYSNTGVLAQHSFVAALNSAGGSSGSPILNTKGQVVGLNYAGDNLCNALALYSDTLSRALTALQHGRVPLRRHIGAFVSLSSMDHAVRAGHLPAAQAAMLRRRFPHANSRVLTVKGLLAGAPACDKLEIGDVIVSVDNHFVGPSLGNFNRLLDSAKAPGVLITFYRQGGVRRAAVPTYDLQTSSPRRLLLFGGATFYEADEWARFRFGVLPKSVMIKHVVPASAFAQGLLPSLSGLNSDYWAKGVGGCALHGKTMDQLIRDIPALIKQSYFTMPIRWLKPVIRGYNSEKIMSQPADMCLIPYDPTSNAVSSLIEFASTEEMLLSKQKKPWRVRNLS